VPRAGLLRLTKKLSAATIEQRRSFDGIGPRRAEIIVAGAHVFAELCTELSLTSFRYLPFGLRDGILAQMAADDEDIGLRKQLAGERHNAVLNLAAHYHVDMRFATHVADHAQRLFKLLAHVHRLPPECAMLLNAAALLHEVGSFISRAGRRRHTCYILAHSELLGFTLTQRRFIAAITRYVGKSKIIATSPPVRVLAPEYRLLLPRAVLLLRLARAVEQGRRGAVLSLRAKVDPASVRITLVTRPSGAELELWALEKERNYFSEVFGRELTCAEA
jgi:exopolyphosphatase/guanosine-5'-triphosphate,3'-diphosphate pyrophosphatase